MERLGLCAAALIVAAPALAHHSGTMFDDTKTVTLEGVVKEFRYTNPHSQLLVDVTGADGTVTTWRFEAEGPSSLMLMQVAPRDFNAGTKVTVSGHPMKDGRPAAWWTKAVRADGTEFYPRGRAAAGATN
jgi:uncharacterized protein DUF6152